MIRLYLKVNIGIDEVKYNIIMDENNTADDIPQYILKRIQ